MTRILKLLFRTGCLLSLVAPILAMVLYPKANWLFAIPLVGIALLIFNILTKSDPLPNEVADRAERILSGSDGAWDGDDYEHLNPKRPELREAWESTLRIHCSPEEWGRLDEGKKSQLSELIRKMRGIQVSQSSRRL